MQATDCLFGRGLVICSFVWCIFTSLLMYVVQHYEYANESFLIRNCRLCIYSMNYKYWPYKFHQLKPLEYGENKLIKKPTLIARICNWKFPSDALSLNSVSCILDAKHISYIILLPTKCYPWRKKTSTCKKLYKAKNLYHENFVSYFIIKTYISYKNSQIFTWLNDKFDSSDI